MKILIVENDVIVGKIWRKWLSRLHEVRSAESAATALEAIDEELPDLVILDLRLNGPNPASSGLRVFNYLREKANNIPVIFITGLEYNVELYQEAKKISENDSGAGINTELVRKPISIHKLTELVDKVA